MRLKAIRGTEKALPANGTGWRSVGALLETLRANAALVRYVMVGGLGFLNYQATLFLLYDSPVFTFLPAKDASVNLGFFEHSDVRLLISTLAATEVTLIGMFTGHHLWTFRDRNPASGSMPLKLGQYHAKMLVSALLIFTGSINLLVVQFGVYPYLAAAVGTVLAFAWNWLWDSVVIWGEGKRPGAA
jgi:putative flippase GtrA